MTLDIFQIFRSISLIPNKYNNIEKLAALSVPQLNLSMIKVPTF